MPLDTPVAELGPAIGKVQVLYGTASAKSGAGMRELARGDAVYENDHIFTGHESALEIKFADNTMLSLAQDSSINLDTYVFDTDSGAGDVLFKLSQGAFRMATGVIVDNNPDKFKVQSPLATIGIRGTTTAHNVPGVNHPGQAETHGLIDFDGKPVQVQSNAGGPPAMLFQDGTGVGASAGGLSSQGFLSAGMMHLFDSMSPENMANNPPAFTSQPDFGPPAEESGGGGDGGIEDMMDDEDDGGPGDNADAGPDDASTDPGVPFPVEAGIAGQPSIIPSLELPGLPGTGPGSVQGTVAGTVEEPVSDDPLHDDGNEGLSHDDADIIDKDGQAEPEVPLEEPSGPVTEEALTASEGEDTTVVSEPETVAAPTSGDLLHGGTWYNSTADYSAFTNTPPNGVTVTLDYSASHATYPQGDSENLNSGIVNVAGSEFIDILNGDGRANVFHGKGGPDELHGGDGNDHLFGDDGNDQLHGDNGTDFLNGGAGADQLDGGAGADTFIYSAYADSNSSATDSISNFEADGTDKVDLSAFETMNWDMLGFAPGMGPTGATHTDYFRDSGQKVPLGTVGCPYTGGGGGIGHTVYVDLNGDGNWDAAQDLQISINIPSGNGSLDLADFILPTP